MSKLNKKECNNCCKEGQRLLIQDVSLSLHYTGGMKEYSDLDFCSIKCMGEWLEERIKALEGNA